jgi:hypothetical protein
LLGDRIITMALAARPASAKMAACATIPSASNRAESCRHTRTTIEEIRKEIERHCGLGSRVIDQARRRVLSRKFWDFCSFSVRFFC